MFVQVIDGRYTVEYDILKSYLKDLFEDGKFEIIVSHCARKNHMHG